MAWQCQHGKNQWREVAVYLWANAEDFKDELLALAVTKLASEESQQHRSGKYGPRGPYNTDQSKAFFDLLLYDTLTKFLRSGVGNVHH